MTIPFESTEEFLGFFDLESQTQYRDPVIFTDGKVGFSIKRDYPDNIRYKAAVKTDNTPDNVVTIWVGYTHHRATKKEIDLIIVGAADHVYDVLKVIGLMVHRFFREGRVRLDGPPSSLVPVIVM